ncbi:MAG: carbohydrate ABC transporter permease [Caldilineaceae bacterium SB0670_bin_27]|uniref:Carbohydrate ABC transporter permease n=1 Tax=Caldilineaceae bacterium SB0664_bin_27 TaxID=2605260 RepID=A0A6B0YZ48_9CHLR|nr:carbohydrate ABC transporter permease [Caldilineaceae bacterium SB0664_bin_27]MYJ76891.1 carbohydrate ABC transporter permease [Caldilineaceae bacterium SB0670_bin_27]
MANQDFVGIPSQVDTRALNRGATDFQRLRRGLLFNYLVLGAGAILMIVPFIWMISTSFKPQAETVSFPPRLFPINPTISNYIDVFDRANMGRLYWNTTFISVIKTVFNIYTSALLGYIFGKFIFRGRDIIFYILLSTWIIPFEVYLIPLYLMTVQVGWADTYTALIVPEIFTIYAMFMFRQFMYTIPTELIDAARIDGAGEWYIFHRIIIPLSRAALFTLIAFYFMWNWNDFLWPLVVISSHDKYVITVGLATFVGEFWNQYGVIMAGASLAIIPILALFIAVQRFIIEGVVLTGLKG